MMLKICTWLCAVVLTAIGILSVALADPQKPDNARVPRSSPTQSIPKKLKYPEGNQTVRHYKKVADVRIATDAAGEVRLGELVAWLNRQPLPVADGSLLRRVLAYTGRIRVPLQPGNPDGPKQTLAKFEFTFTYKERALPPSTRQAVYVYGSEGKVLFIEDQNLPQNLDQVNDVVPSVSREAARAKALQHAKEMVAKLYDREAPLDVRPDVRANVPPVIWVDRERGGRLTWSFVVSSLDAAAPFTRRYWIAAKERAAIVDFEDLIYFASAGAKRSLGESPPEMPQRARLSPALATPKRREHRLDAAALARVEPAAGTSGNVTATVWRSSPFDPANHKVGLRNLELSCEQAAGKFKHVTDGQGRFDFPAGGMITIRATLSGPFCRILNEASPVLEVKKDGVGTIDLEFTSLHEHEIAQVSAYYWVNEARHFIQEYLPSTPARLLNVKTYVNRNHPGDAHWDQGQGTLNFSRSDEPFPNTAYRDIILHEYGHAIDTQLGGVVDVGYSEGFGDTFALLYKSAVLGIDDPVIGPDFYGKGMPMRNATHVVPWEKVKDQQNEDVHETGEVFLGFSWELLKNLMTRYPKDRAKAVAVAKELILGAAANNPSNIPNAVRLSFFVDAFRYPGAPPEPPSQHYNELCNAARARGIPIPRDPLDLTSGWQN